MRRKIHKDEDFSSDSDGSSYFSDESDDELEKKNKILILNRFTKQEVFYLLIFIVVVIYLCDLDLNLEGNISYTSDEYVGSNDKEYLYGVYKIENKLDDRNETVIFDLGKQVINPFSNKKGKRSVGCLREECRGLSLEDLVDRNFRIAYKRTSIAQEVINTKVSLMLTDSTDLFKLKNQREDVYKTLIGSQEGRTYISAIEGADSIGGNKGLQLRVKTNYCAEYNEIDFQPRQFRPYKKQECQKLQKYRGFKSFLIKPETGSQGKGISFYRDIDELKSSSTMQKYFPCKTRKMGPSERHIVQEYISSPLLMYGSKFDIRVYLLISSTKPFIVFFHDGYLRRSLSSYDPSSKKKSVFLTNTHFQSSRETFSLSKHVIPFDQFNEYLYKSGNYPKNFLQTAIKPYIKRVSRFVFLAAKERLSQRKGSFQIFGLDFMMDSKLNIHFIEANGYPGFTWSINFDTRQMAADMFDLVFQLNEVPSTMARLTQGNHYGSFELLYSETLPTDINNDDCKFASLMNRQEYFNGVREGVKQLVPITSPYAKVKTEISEAQLLDTIDDCLHKHCKSNKKLISKEARKYKTRMERRFEGLGDEIDTLPTFGQIGALMKQAKAEGCVFNKLNLMPATYRMHEKEECMKMKKYRTITEWVVRDKTTRTVEFFHTQDSFKDKIICPSPQQVIVQKHISRLTIAHKQWDLHFFALIARTDPLLSFVSKGFALEFDINKESRESELMISVEEFQRHLSFEGKTGAHFVDVTVMPFVEELLRTMILSSAQKFKTTTFKPSKNYKVVELVVSIDSSFQLHFIDTIFNPSFTRFTSTSKTLQVESMKQTYFDEIRDDMIELTLQASMSPQLFLAMNRGDGFGNFKLVFNEALERAETKQLDPNICSKFKQKWGPDQKMLKQVNSLHNIQFKTRKANLREFKKYTKIAYEKCRVKSTPTFCTQHSKATRSTFKKRVELYFEKERVDYNETQVEELIIERFEGLSGLNLTDVP